MNLTQAAIPRLTCPPGKSRVRVYDTQVPGLCVTITPSGKQCFYWYARVRGQLRPVEYLIGATNKITVGIARDRAKKFNADATAGISPATALKARKVADRGDVTVQQLWEDYRDHRLKPDCSPHTLATDTSRYKLHLSVWAGRRLGTITPADVIQLHRDLAGAQTASVATKTVKLLRRMLTYKGVDPNPAASKKGDKSKVYLKPDAKSTRFLSTDELQRLSVALANAANQTIADAIRFALLTGARKGNICRARWSDIHTTQKMWIIPASESKNGQPMTIVLAPEAIALLKVRRALVKDSEYVFPGRMAGKPLTEVKTTWDRIRTAAGLTDVRVHDLRHSLASHMAMGGASMLAIGKQLGHQDQASTHRYAHLDLASIRPATEAAVASMFAPPTQAPDAPAAAPATGKLTQGKKRGKRAAKDEAI